MNRSPVSRPYPQRRVQGLLRSRDQRASHQRRLRLAVGRHLEEHEPRLQDIHDRRRLRWVVPRESFISHYTLFHYPFVIRLRRGCVISARVICSTLFSKSSTLIRTSHTSRWPTPTRPRVRSTSCCTTRERSTDGTTCFRTGSTCSPDN